MDKNKESIVWNGNGYRVFFDAGFGSDSLLVAVSANEGEQEAINQFMENKSPDEVKIYRVIHEIKPTI